MLIFADAGEAQNAWDNANHWAIGIITKSELGLQGTQMADLYTREPVCLHGRVKGVQ